VHTNCQCVLDNFSYILLRLKHLIYYPGIAPPGHYLIKICNFFRSSARIPSPFFSLTAPQKSSLDRNLYDHLVCRYRLQHCIRLSVRQTYLPSILMSVVSYILSRNRPTWPLFAVKSPISLILSPQKTKPLFYFSAPQKNPL